MDAKQRERLKALCGEMAEERKNLHGLDVTEEDRQTLVEVYNEAWRLDRRIWLLLNGLPDVEE